MTGAGASGKRERKGRNGRIGRDGWDEQEIEGGDNLLMESNDDEGLQVLLIVATMANRFSLTRRAELQTMNSFTLPRVLKIPCAGIVHVSGVHRLQTTHIVARIDALVPLPHFDTGSTDGTRQNRGFDQVVEYPV